MVDCVNHEVIIIQGLCGITSNVMAFAGFFPVAAIVLL